MQLHWIMENAKTLRSVDGVATLVTGLRDATKRYNISVYVLTRIQRIPSARQQC
jgi:hypothetical protein